MDLINRQDAIGKIQTWLKHSGYSEGERNVMGCTIQMLEGLPSAQKTGKWKHDGSQWENRWVCGCGYKLFFKPTNYCPNCGAYMRGEKDE